MKKFIAFILTTVILMCGFVGTVGATSKTQEYLTLQTPGTTIRNDFAAFVGMKLTVGNEDMTVTDLGRLYYGGFKGANDETHEVRIVSANSQLVASVTVPAGGTDGKLTYAHLDTPITLKANQSYFVVSCESSTDYWYGSVSEGGATFSVTADAVCDGAYYQTDTDGLQFASYDTAGPFVGVGFKYYKANDEQKQGESKEYLSLNTSGKTLRNDFPGYIGMKLTVGNKNLKVTELGRLFYGGTKGANDEDHEVRLVSADGMLLASVVVPAGGTDGKVTYAALSAPITLTAGQSYYLVSLESATDYWYGSAGEGGATFSCENVATCDGAYYQTDEEGLSFALYDATGPFVGTSFKYEIDNSNDDDSDTPTPPEIDNSKNNSSDTSTSPKPMVKRDFFVKYQGTPTPRNNYEGYVGMKITVGAKPISVYSLGRIFIAGNTQSHHVKLVDAETGKDIEGSTVTVKDGTDGKITYARLDRPILLEAGHSYYIVSEEKDGGDFWYHNDAEILCQKDAKIDSAVFNYQGVWNLEGALNCAFGVVSMQYEVEADSVPVLGDVVPFCAISTAVLLGLLTLAFVSLRVAKKMR